MSDLPLISDLLSEAEKAQDYPKLRQIVMQMQPGPWNHHLTDDWDGLDIKHFICDKCKQKWCVGTPGKPWKKIECPLPDPVTDPMPVVAEMLLKMLPYNSESIRLLCDGCDAISDPKRKFLAHSPLPWFIIRADAATQVALALLVMGKCRVKE